jgi:hypothetical protein
VVCDADQLDRNGVRALTRVNCPNGTPVCEFCARGRETRLGRSGSAPNRELNLSEEVFLSSDKSQIYAGDLWLQKIKEALSAAELVILMLSQRSVARPWVNFEAGPRGWRTKRLFRSATVIYRRMHFLIHIPQFRR